MTHISVRKNCWIDHETKTLHITGNKVKNQKFPGGLVINIDGNNCVNADYPYTGDKRDSDR